MNAGIEQPSSINPYFKRKVRKRELSVQDFVDGITKGDVTILSQAVTLVESVRPEHQAIAQEVIEKCLPYSGNSIRVGISGVPGAGKSTSIDVFGLHVLERSAGKLAVLAIDPSSERSKGSILGDKTRMEQLSVHPDSFIRTSPSAGSLGGVARKTRETIILCEAAGFNQIFVETVGVGQSETAVHSMVDFFLLIQLAGTGDELQGIKRGIMEMADGIVINKADGNNIDKANLAASQFRNALHLFPAPDSGWTPQVLTYSGFYNKGLFKQKTVCAASNLPTFCACGAAVAEYNAGQFAGREHEKQYRSPWFVGRDAAAAPALPGQPPAVFLPSHSRSWKTPHLRGFFLPVRRQGEKLTRVNSLPAPRDAGA